MATNQALVDFRKSYPIDFKLLDKDDQAVMYISEDKDDWELNLTVENTSSQSITMIDGTGDTSKTNHHLGLRFRAGTLAQRAIKLLTSGDSKNVIKTTDWSIAKLSQPPANAEVTLYLRYTGANKTLKAKESHSIKLSGISAAPGVGSRGTQVELIPNQLKFDGEAGAAITNSRTQYLHVTNHSGRKNIPLHVGFVGGNRVLNGDPNAKLTLRITNVYKAKDVRLSTIAFRGPNSPTKEPQTELVFSYDKGNDEWELGNLSAGKPQKEGDPVQATVIAVNKDKSLNLSGQSISQGDRPEWLMSFDKDFELKYGESFDVEISGIVVSAKAGQANLYLHYNSVPGYWDGQFVCAVEKGPIIVNGNDVGIGTTAPVGKLNIVGSDKGRGIQIDNGEIKIRHDNNAHFSIINGRVPSHLTIDNSGNDLKMNSGFGPEGGPIRKALLSISSDGRVGVGVDDATAKLDVDGETKTKSLTVAEVSSLHTLKLTADASSPMETPGGGTIQLGGGSLELGWSADPQKKPTWGWIQSHGAQLAINPLGYNVAIGTTAKPGMIVQILGDLEVSGGVTTGRDWKEMVQFGALYKLFTSVASRRDADGTVHLRGLLFSPPGKPKEGEYVCRLSDPSHYPSHYRDFVVTGLTSSSDPVACKLQVLGAEAVEGERGWIKVIEYDFDPTKMISLDGVSFKI